MAQNKATVPMNNDQSAQMQFFENLYRFVLGGISGSKVHHAAVLSN